MSLELATELKTITIDKVNGEFTFQKRDPRPGAAGSLIVGYITHDDLTINNVVYEGDTILVLYDKVWYEKNAGFRLEFERYSKRDFTAAAQERVINGLTPEVQEFFEIPTVEQINAEVLEDAYNAGTQYGKNFESSHRLDGVSRTIRDWSRAYDSITGKRWGHEYSLPDWPGVVSDLELKAEFLAAAQAEIAKQLAKVDAALNA